MRPMKRLLLTTRPFVLAATLASLSVVSSAQTKPVASPTPVYDSDEPYKVYDALFRYMGENQHLHGDKVAIMTETTTAQNQPLLAKCLYENAAALPADAVTDFHAQNSHTWRLQARIPVGRNYELLASTFDSRIAIEGLVPNNPDGIASQPKYDFQGYWELSAVGFSKSRDHAIAYAFYTCGITCGFGSPFLFSKHGEAWQLDRWLCQIVS
jgi:hypothetical protein